MTIQEQDSQFDGLPDGNPSPIYIVEGNLYVSTTEWDRLCHEQDTGPLVSVLRDARRYLSGDRSVRLIGADGSIEVSADRPSEFQRILDNANDRRASLGLAPATPLD